MLKSHFYSTTAEMQGRSVGLSVLRVSLNRFHRQPRRLNRLLARSDFSYGFQRIHTTNGPSGLTTTPPTWCGACTPSGWATPRDRTLGAPTERTQPSCADRIRAP